MIKVKDRAGRDISECGAAGLSDDGSAFTGRAADVRPADGCACDRLADSCADGRAAGFSGWDMHTHTWYSDGTLSPTRLVEMAAEKGIHTLAITDHDGAFGLREGAAAAEARGIRFITGVEFSAELPTAEIPGFFAAQAPESGGPQVSVTGPQVSVTGAQTSAAAPLAEIEPAAPRTAYMHILGYGFDPDDPALSACLAEIREQRKARNEKMRGALEELGYFLSKEDIEVYPGQDYIGKPNFARALVQRGCAADVPQAFSSPRMLAAPSVKAIHREKIHAAEAISLIRAAGGFASLAHPFQVTWSGRREETEERFAERLELILRALTDLGLCGMECFYSSHTKEQGDRLLAMADRYGLTVTAGSDYHGPGMKKDVELGGIHGF